VRERLTQWTIGLVAYSAAIAVIIYAVVAMAVRQLYLRSIYSQRGL